MNGYSLLSLREILFREDVEQIHLSDAAHLIQERDAIDQRRNIWDQGLLNSLFLLYIFFVYVYLSYWYFSLLLSLTSSLFIQVNYSSLRLPPNCIVCLLRTYLKFWKIAQKWKKSWETLNKGTVRQLLFYRIWVSLRVYNSSFNTKLQKAIYQGQARTSPTAGTISRSCCCQPEDSTQPQP